MRARRDEVLRALLNSDGVALRGLSKEEAMGIRARRFNPGCCTDAEFRIWEEAAELVGFKASAKMMEFCDDCLPWYREEKLLQGTCRRSVLMKVLSRAMGTDGVSS